MVAKRIIIIIIIYIDFIVALIKKMFMSFLHENSTLYH